MLNPNFVTHRQDETENHGKFIIEPLPSSFAHSMGNAFRRTLLSSLKGSAITNVKIGGVSHLFTTIKGLKESTLELVLNLKNLRFQTSGDGPFTVKLEARGTKKLYGRDVEGEVEVINKDLYLGELTDEKSKLEIEAVVEVGYGFSKVEERENKQTGFIAVDAFFSPVTRVNFSVEEARVGRKTNLDRLIIEVWTDGSVKPADAMRTSAELLSSYFNFVLSGSDNPVSEQIKSADDVKQETMDKKLYETIIDELNLPSRVINALLREHIETVADLIKVGREKLSTMKGVGKKSIELIEEELNKMGIKMN